MCLDPKIFHPKQDVDLFCTAQAAGRVTDKHRHRHGIISCNRTHWIHSMLFKNKHEQEAKVIWQRLHRMCFPSSHIAVGGQDPNLTLCSLGPQECSPQTEPQSVQSFLHTTARLSYKTDRQTDWQTLAIIGNNNLHLMHLIHPKKNLPEIS